MTSSRARTVLVAPTAFKGTLGPVAVARAMAEGVGRAWPRARVVVRASSDGGTGFLEAYEAAAGGAVETLEVTGPLGAPTRARMLWVGRTAVIESAEACGIHLLPRAQRDPLAATTRGVGDLLLAARGRAGEIILGLGGSGSVDGGTGMARALGWDFLDHEARPLPEGGGSLADLELIAAPAERWAIRVVALCDVANPLTGPAGAARVYGPQKGAGAREVERLDSGLARLAAVIGRQLGDLDVAHLAGSGAAGGLGAGARAFLGAELVSGAEWMIERTGVADGLDQADLVVTGEGRFDAQSGMGKVTGRLVQAASGIGVPVLLVCGRIEGPLPPGVSAVQGAGRILGARDIAQLVESACRSLALGDRL